MERTPLSELLARVHRELEQTGDVDENSRAMLRTVLADIEVVLEQPAPAPSDEPHPLGERLRDASWRFEESHPKLAMTIEQIIEALQGPFQ